jgi:hypothetical protein
MNNTPTSPSLLPDNWNEWVKEEAANLFGMSQRSKLCGMWKNGATSVLQKVLPELERLNVENNRLYTVLQGLIKVCEGWGYGKTFAIQAAKEAMNSDKNPAA